MKYDELHAIIRSCGWAKLRQKATSHVIYIKEGHTPYPVPYHKGKEVGKGLLRKTIKEMKLKY